MNELGEDRIKKLLKQALPPMGEAELERDLWPDMLRRMDAAHEAPPWFDWALAAALAGFVAFVPMSIPVLLYYL
ncbi:MAG TPA: hypothetical protein VMU48_08385 [Terracidiphilus sp.]|nr:hypothetical protein [Terracidiphilus sp.]